MSEVKVSGHVFARIEYSDGRSEEIDFPNTILRKGRNALARCLTNDLDDSFQFYVSRMLFGDGGTSGGAVKFVNTERNGLFGVTRVDKPVSSQVDPDIPHQAIFTSVVTRSDANGYTLNEMALQMANGDLYSMVTFSDLNKTEQMQIIFNWRVSIL